MIFYILIVLIVSLFAEVLMFYYLPPIENGSRINYLNAILFSLNSGVLIASLYSLILFFVYWLMKAYDEIIYKAFFRRAILLGMVISLSLFMRIIGVLDWFILIGIVISVICLEVILNRKD